MIASASCAITVRSALSAGSPGALLAFVFGAAIANVIRGVPLNAQGYFFEPLWTDLDPRSATPGILDWYTVLIGLLALAALILHGANFLVTRCVGALEARARRTAAQAWLATLALTVLGTGATFYVRPELLNSFAARPWGAVFPLLAIAGLFGTRALSTRAQDLKALVASGAYLAAMLASRFEKFTGSGSKARTVIPGCCLAA